MNLDENNSLNRNNFQPYFFSFVFTTNKLKMPEMGGCRIIRMNNKPGAGRKIENDI